MTEPQPRPTRKPGRVPHWAGYIIVAVCAFLFGMVVQGNPTCTGLAAPAPVVVTAAA